MGASQYLSYEKIGVSKVASVGNKLNVDEVDLLEYFLADPQTEIVFLYLEGLSRGREFFELVRSATKPIIVHKSNRSSLSQGIARSHTNALASNDLVVEGALKQAGTIRVNSFEELVNCSKALLLPPLNGNSLVSLSGGGGASVVIADECQQNGFNLPPLPGTVLDWLESKGRAKVINLTNPIDLGDLYDLELYIDLIEKLIILPQVDGIFMNFGYARGWEKDSRTYQKLFDYFDQFNRDSSKPLILRMDVESPNEMEGLQKRFSTPFFKSISGALTAMRKVQGFRLKVEGLGNHFTSLKND
jgi:acetyltransferase